MDSINGWFLSKIASPLIPNIQDKPNSPQNAKVVQYNIYLHNVYHREPKDDG